VREGAEGGLLDSSGKLWAWKLYQSLEEAYRHTPETNWCEPDRHALEDAIQATEPKTVQGAQLLLVDGPRTVWNVRRGGELWVFDGKQWAERKAGLEGRFDGTCVEVEKRSWLFGTQSGVQIFNGEKWKNYELIPVSLARNVNQKMLNSIRDQNGQVYVYYAQLGSIWAVDAPAADGFPVLREIPVSDVLDHQGVGQVYRHPDGSKEKPALIAGDFELRSADLKGVQSASAEEFARLLRKLDADDFESREAARKEIALDVQERTWRFPARMFELKAAELSVEIRKTLQHAAIAYVAAAQPGRSRDFARLLVQLGTVDESALRNFTGSYRELWRVLEEYEVLDRVTRVGFQREQRERHLEGQHIRERFDDEDKLLLPIGGRIDHAYRLRVSWGHYTFEGRTDVAVWEEKENRRVWLGNGCQLWMCTNEPDEARRIIFEGALELKSKPVILGRDKQGRLLIAAAFEQRKKDGMPWKSGIWALSEPNPVDAPKENK
jgi:hypothetical protein